MTNAEIDRKLATECMGYTEREEKPFEFAGKMKTDHACVEYVDGERFIAYKTLPEIAKHDPDSEYPIWSPSSNIAQAFECAEKFHEYVLGKDQYDDRGPYFCTISNEKMQYIGHGHDKAPAMAICLAILAAIEKGKEDDLQML